jgi:hypothetical protein
MEANVNAVVDPMRRCGTGCAESATRSDAFLQIIFRISGCTIENRAGAPVGSQLVVFVRHRELTLRPRAATGLLLTWAAVCSLLLASCGGSASSDPTTSSTAKTGSTTTTSSTSAADGQIISAWLAAQKAFHDAALTSDPNAPELAATTIPPILDTVRANLAHFRDQGDIAKGPSYWGAPQITARGTGGTQVASCVHGEEIEIVAKTGKPVPGVPGQAVFELVTSVMQLTANGWKLAEQSVEVGKCASS